MSTKNGWFSVLRTSATVFLSSVGGASRLHDETTSGERQARGTQHEDDGLRMSI